MLTHWSQLVPNMSTDIRGHEATQPNRTELEEERGEEEEDVIDGYRFI